MGGSVTGLSDGAPLRIRRLTPFDFADKVTPGRPHWQPMAAPRPVTVIHLQAQAPAKPAWGQACNGCGVCCAWQPCPLGVLVSRRRHGACDALRWHGDGPAPHYRCAMVAAPQQVWPWLPRRLRPAVQALASRWIAAGAGCDCDAEANPAD